LYLDSAFINAIKNQLLFGFTLKGASNNYNFWLLYFKLIGRNFLNNLVLPPLVQKCKIN